MSGASDVAAVDVNGGTLALGAANRLNDTAVVTENSGATLSTAHVGVDFEYQVQEKVSLVGRLGYIHDFSDSEESVSAAFAASGSDGLPFAVAAPGIDNQAVTLGLGGLL